MDHSLSTFQIIGIMFENGEAGWALYNSVSYCFTAAFILLALKYPRRWVFLAGSYYTVANVVVGSLFPASTNGNAEWMLLSRLLEHIARLMRLVGFWVLPPACGGDSNHGNNNEGYSTDTPKGETATGKSAIPANVTGKWVHIIGATAVLVCMGFFARFMVKSATGQFGMRHSPASSQPTQSASGLVIRKSARQLIQEYAEARHGRNADVEIVGGFYGGAYQVTVRVQIPSGIYAGGYDRFSYTATVDEESQRITSWQLYDHN